MQQRLSLSAEDSAEDEDAPMVEPSDTGLSDEVSLSVQEKITSGVKRALTNARPKTNATVDQLGWIWSDVLGKNDDRKFI